MCSASAMRMISTHRSRWSASTSISPASQAKALPYLPAGAASSMSTAYCTASARVAPSSGLSVAAANAVPISSDRLMIGEYPWGVYAPGMRWPWQSPPPANTISISDPLVVSLFSPNGLTELADIRVNESTVLGISAFWRATNLIGSTLAGLPMLTYQGDGPDRRVVPSVFDNPDGDDGQTVFEWKETAFLHLQLWGRCGALKLRNGAGGTGRLELVHPSLWTPVVPSLDEFKDPAKMPRGGLWFDVHMPTGEQARFDADDFWYVPAVSTRNGIGLSVLSVARTSLATTIAGDNSAGNMFANGAMMSGIATPADDGVDITDDVPEIRKQLRQHVQGHENAGTIAVINRRLNITPWSMSAVDAQFLQSRQFQIEEISRWTGVPPHLLMQTDKQTSWGTGVDSQEQGMSKFVIGGWANRFEQRATREVARPRTCEFDFAALERPNFAIELGLDLQQVAAGVMTKDEYRAKRGWTPLPAAPPPPSGGPDDPAAA